MQKGLRKRSVVKRKFLLGKPGGTFSVGCAHGFEIAPCRVNPELIVWFRDNSALSFDSYKKAECRLQVQRQDLSCDIPLWLFMMSYQNI